MDKPLPEYLRKRLEEYDRVRKYTMGLDRPIHNKALRHLAAVYPGLNVWGVEFLCALGMWTYYRHKEGGPARSIINWSGARSNWKRGMWRGLEEALAIGAAENVKSANGYSVRMTAKGQQIMESYHRRWKEIAEDIISRWEAVPRPKRIGRKKATSLEPV